MTALLLIAVLYFSAPTHTLGFLPPPLPEASGMALAYRRPGAVWLINDGDHPAALHRFDTADGALCSYPVEGLDNRDWEALASFLDDGTPWLAIADVGDNNAVHSHLRIGLLREPAHCGGAVTVERLVQIRLPEGPADIEAAVVDTRHRQIMLITKRQRPPRVYTATLDGPGSTVVTAREIARLTDLPAPSTGELAADPDMGRWLAQPTGAALSPDGAVLALLTYRNIVFYRRGTATWGDRLNQPPSGTIDFVRLPQQEALAFVDAQTLVVTSENRPAPLLALTLPRE